MNQKNGNFISLDVRLASGNCYPYSVSKYSDKHNQIFSVGSIQEIIDSRCDDRFSCSYPAIVVKEKLDNFGDNSSGQEVIYFVPDLSYEELTALLMA
jgi:hypothetical protein